MGVSSAALELSFQVCRQTAEAGRACLQTARSLKIPFDLVRVFTCFFTPPVCLMLNLLGQYLPIDYVKTLDIWIGHI